MMLWCSARLEDTAREVENESKYLNTRDVMAPPTENSRRLGCKIEFTPSVSLLYDNERIVIFPF